MLSLVQVLVSETLVHMQWTQLHASLKWPETFVSI